MVSTHLSGPRGIQLPNAPRPARSRPSPRGWMPIVPMQKPCPHTKYLLTCPLHQYPGREAERLRNSPRCRRSYRTKTKLLVDNQVEILGPPIDAVGDESDSDDGDNGDFEEVELFIPCVGGRTTNSSRSVVYAANADYSDQQCLRGVVISLSSVGGTEFPYSSRVEPKLT